MNKYLKMAKKQTKQHAGRLLGGDSLRVIVLELSMIYLPRRCTGNATPARSGFSTFAKRTWKTDLLVLCFAIPSWGRLDLEGGTKLSKLLGDASQRTYVLPCGTSMTPLLWRHFCCYLLHGRWMASLGLRRLAISQ